MNREDIQLIKEAKKNPAAYEALYKKYANRLFNYFWYRLGHQKDIAEDLLQETFMRAYQKLPHFYLRSYSYYSYLLSIAHNVIVDYYRQPKFISLDSVNDVPDEVTQYQKFDQQRNAELLWRAIQQLPTNEKNILLLRYKNNLSIKEIARIIGKSENAVKISLTRIRKKLSRHPYLKAIADFSEHKRQYVSPQFLDRK